METHAAMSQALPEDVLADVLARLPLRSLAVSRCVCKAWRAILAMDEHRRLLLPRSVRGLFINYGHYPHPHFFARLASSSSPSSPGDDYGGGPHIDGKFRFVEGRRRESEVVDHCNGLVLYRPCDDDMEVMHVCNPTTRWSARLPACPTTRRRVHNSGELLGRRRAFLVFDPAASPEYKVLLEPLAPREVGAEGIDGCRSTEWPPPSWTWHEFSSRTRSRRWEEKVFVREGGAAGTVWDLLLNCSSSAEPPWRYAAYWKGELYVHCHGEYVSRLSLLNDKYQVFKSPIDLTECTYDTRTFLGRSENGVYFAAIDSQLRVWMLSESNDETRWVPKHHSDLNTYSWWLQEQKYENLKYDGPWILDIRNKEKNKEVSQQEDVCWNSDDDGIIDVSDDEDESYHYAGHVKFLGFHPYKEVIFLCDKRIAVACHLNSSKVQYLGDTDLGGLYNSGKRESFVYTPCLIGG